MLTLTDGTRLAIKLGDPTQGVGLLALRVHKQGLDTTLVFRVSESDLGVLSRTLTDLQVKFQSPEPFTVLPGGKEE